MSASQLPLVLITHSLPQDWLSALEGECRTILGPLDATELSPELEDKLPEAEGLFCLLSISVTEALLERAPRLRVVSNMAVGVDNIDLSACTRRGIPVGNTPGVLTESTADLTFALLLAIARRLFDANQDARQGRWKTWSPTGWLGIELNGASLGIIGMGKIGRAVARRAAAFGMKIFYSDPTPCIELEQELGVSRLPLQDLLEQCDFITLHTPLTAETRHLIDEKALRSMKPNAILVNTARGQIIDMEALKCSLTEGWIQGAALDVTDPEPLPPTDLLFSLPNCLITPHIGSATKKTRQKMAELACQNLLAGLKAQPLPYCVNPEVYQK